MKMKTNRPGRHAKSLPFLLLCLCIYLPTADAQFFVEDFNSAPAQYMPSCTNISGLNDYFRQATDADISANGASKAKVYATENIEAEASGVSQIRYRGEARVNANSDGLSTVKRD